MSPVTLKQPEASRLVREAGNLLPGDFLRISPVIPHELRRSCLTTQWQINPQPGRCHPITGTDACSGICHACSVFWWLCSVFSMPFMVIQSTSLSLLSKGHVRETLGYMGTELHLLELCVVCCIMYLHLRITLQNCLFLKFQPFLEQITVNCHPL